MKRLLVLVALATGLISHAYGQTYPGQLPANTVLGNSTGGPLPFAVPGAVTNSQMATAPARTSKCNPTSSAAAPSDCQSGFLHSKDFGAVGNGVADDTTALGNWITACQTTLLVCFLDPGTYKISSQLSVTAQIKIIGAGPASAISMSNTTQNGINITTTSPVWLSDFEITTSVTPTAGVGIQVTPASGENGNSHFSGLYFVNIWQGINFVAASHWEVSFCHFELLLAQAIIVANTNNGDSGDSVIMGNDILYTATTSVMIGIYQQSSGGLKIIGNKINSPQIAYDLNPPGNVPVSGITNITGNSFENCAGQCILLDPQSATPANLTWELIQITGNELMCAVANCTLIVANATANPFWINGVNIVGNALVLNNSSGVALGIQVGFAAGFLIGNNYFLNQSSAAGDVGIQILANASNTRISDNTQVNFAAGNWIQSASTSTVIRDNTGIATANLPASAANGSQIFLTDADPQTRPCTHAGVQTGSTAFRQNSQWLCF